MKPAREEPAAPTRVEFEVQFSRGPKGKRRVRAVAVETASVQRIEMVAAPVPALRPVQAVMPARPVVSTPVPIEAPAETPRVPPITLRLVLGHYFEKLVRDGSVKDYAEIALRTGLTRARVTQIVNLTLLAPDTQERILHATENDGAVVERRLRDMVAFAEWRRQRDLWLRHHWCWGAGPFVP